MNGNRCTKRITDWIPYNDKRSKKRPDTRWRDEIEKPVWRSNKLLKIGSYGRNRERPSFASRLT